MGKGKILVVDDEENVRRLLRSMLGNKYIVLEAKDGEVAIDIARSQKPDFILMDIMMPNIDGYTACYTIKQDPATKTIPIVMLTAVGQELNKKLAQEMGADGYITKPFGLLELLNTVERFLTNPE
jgi:CheY-like chemotaxis protein